MDNQIATAIISLDTPERPGAVLFESVCKFTPEGPQYQCRLCQNCILIEKGQSILYQFDTKFLTEEGKITFDKFEQTIALILPLNDQAEWRRVLKDHMNQRGFHQDFKPIKKIGKGNFASVYLVQKNSDNKKYAVKAFSKEAAFSEEHGKECLIKEIEIIRHLKGKNTMKLHEVYESQNSLYIVFELLKGGQLYDKLKSKTKFTPSQIRMMVKGLLEGIKEMHSRGIMHRDLKPENILFRHENDYDCVIADFGLAQFANEQKYLFVRCGTPGYVAPEVINIKDMKQRYSPICDLFSLGLIFHVLLKGKSVFKGTGYNEVLSQNRACDLDLDSAEYNSVEKDAMDLLRKMLQKDPNQRITANEALQHGYFSNNEESPPKKGEELVGKDETLTQTDEPVLGKWRSSFTKGEKDSCLKLQGGKENVMAGKLDTFNAVKSTKISFIGQANRKQKVSKFIKAQGDHI